MHNSTSSSATTATYNSSVYATPLNSLRSGTLSDDSSDSTPTNLSHNNDTTSNASSIYDSATENLSTTEYNSFEASLENNNKKSSSLTDSNTEVNSCSDGEVTLNGSTSSLSYDTTPTKTPIMQMSPSALLIQSESTETNASQDEVDPKSQLANKTIFKTDNPNLSIIEISDNSIKEQELKNSVLVIEKTSEDDDDDDDDDDEIITKSPSKTSSQTESDATTTASTYDLRRKKAETLIQSSKQKLDIDIAEASATESNNATNGANESERNALHGSAVLPAASSPRREIKLYETLDDFDKNLPNTVQLLQTPFGSKVYLVGTAHFSEESQDDVSLVIRNVRPDVVMVELCPSRIHILKLDERTLLEEAKNINLAKIRSIIQAHGYINGIFFILLLQMSAQIAKDLGMAPGGEFRRAFEEVHKLPGCILHLGDRPIRITLHRALRALSLWQTMKLVWRITSTDTISIEEVEECKQSDLLEKLMQEMAGEFPSFSEVFVKERDLFLCHSLQMSALPQPTNDGSGRMRPVRVVGVVGIGHANGIAKLWGKVDPEKIPAIMEIPPAAASTRALQFTIKYGLIGLTIFGAFKLLRPRLGRLL